MTIDKENLKALAERAVASNPPGGDGNPFPALAVRAVDILALLAEIEQLRDSYEQVCGNYNRVSFASHERGEQIYQLKAENEALRKDAERYRWLRDQCGIVEYKAIAGSVGRGMLPSGEKLQAAVDAAMAREASHG